MLETTWSRKGGEGGKLPVDNSYKGRFPSGTRVGAARCTREGATRCTRCTSTREGAASPCCKKLRCLLCPAQGGRFWRPCLDHVVNPPLATCCPPFSTGWTRRPWPLCWCYSPVRRCSCILHLDNCRTFTQNRLCRWRNENKIKSRLLGRQWYKQRPQLWNVRPWSCASTPAISLTSGSWDPDLYFCHFCAATFVPHLFS